MKKALCLVLLALLSGCGDAPRSDGPFDPGPLTDNPFNPGPLDRADGEEDAPTT